MDFKSILSKLDSMEAPVVVPAAPKLPEAVQLNEDAQLRVLSGRTTYVAEAAIMEKAEKESAAKDLPKKKKKEEAVEEGFDSDAKAGDTFKTATGGTATKTKSGVKHTAGNNYSAEKQPFDKAKKTKKVSILDKDDDLDEGAKPDFLDMDKDGDKKEPMKKAVADKKGNKPKKGVNPFAKKTESKMMPKGKKRPVKESVEGTLSFKECIQLVRESGGQQQIDPLDKELFAWAQRVAASKFNESVQQDAFAGVTYERMGGRFQLFDVLAESKK